MTADKMFKKLGYKLFENSHAIIYSNDSEDIVFYKKSYDYYCDTMRNVTPELHKAITKKLEELGWL